MSIQGNLLLSPEDDRDDCVFRLEKKRKEKKRNTDEARQEEASYGTDLPPTKLVSQTAASQQCSLC